MKRRGFTIVEIVIVITVIAIVAAIVVVGYGAWQTSVAKKQVKSDLTGVVAGMESARNFSEDGYPVFLEDTEFDDSSTIFQPSEDVSILYVRGDEKSYCIQVTSNLHPEIVYFMNSANGNTELKEGECPPSPNNGVVTTVINGGVLDYPTGIAVDAQKNLYVAETNKDRILKITQAGVTTVLAGGTAGYLDGTGAAARFDTPYGVAVDASGYVYVVDYGNSRIRKISPAGVVTTLAGSSSGYANGTGAAARFNDPYAVVVDPITNNLYITETGNQRVRMVTQAGVVTSLAGQSTGYQDGTGTAARFDDPVGIAIHSDGNIFVVETGNDKIRKITSTGVVTTVAGAATGFLDAVGTSARFNGPTGIGIRGNIAYIADSWNNRVRMLNTKTGKVVTLAGSGGAGDVDATGTGAQFNFPTGIAVSNDDVVYIVESNAGQIRRIE
ncbi:MAG: NHL repeat-containing protein [Candidatus Microsaccharimonas sp.]